MAEFRDEIDNVFKNRFSGVKNHQFDPAAGWVKLKSELGANIAYQTAAKVQSFHVGVVAKIAASILIVVTAVSDSESLTKKLIKPVPNLGVTMAKSDPSTDSQKTSKVSRKINEAEKVPYVAVAQNAPSTATAFDGYGLSGINDNRQPLDWEESNAALASNDTDVNSPAEYSTSNHRGFESIDLMPRRVYAYEHKEIADREHKPQNPIISKWKDDHIWFFRGGARAGKGESNSLASQAQWAVNPMFAFGYGFSFTDQSFISIEIGVMRKSGNVIERVRKQPVSSIVASFASLASDKNTVEMHRGLVADRLDFIHFPLMFNWVATRGWNLSAGGFGNYLYAARNQSITVYNARDYVKTRPSLDEVTSLDGLTRLRYGMIFGAERQLTHHVSAYAQIMMPLNEPINEKGEYESFGAASKSADGQLGLLYSF